MRSLKNKNIKYYYERLKNIVVHGYCKRLIGNKGTYIMKEDWDNLIVLDACRYDMFEKLNNIRGKLEYRISRGSCTSEFLLENFKEQKFIDTIYITANPLVNYDVSKSFAEIVSVWKDGWSDEFETVLPTTMVKYTLKANKKYPEKRLIVHFMQPHYPFIGEDSRAKIGEHDGVLSRNLFFAGKSTDHTTQEVWNLLREGKVDKKNVWEAYEENLKIVLEYVKKLIDKLQGKTIVTSDHGNLFGEWLCPFPIKEYGHPGGIYFKNLIRVPWLIVNKGGRKQITECEKIKIDKVLEESRIKERLKSLGYID